MELWLFALLPALAVGQLAMVTGGIGETSVSATEEPMVCAVHAINQHLAADTGSDPHHQLSLVSIVHASKQVVAGWKIYLTLQMTQDYTCDITVWYRDYMAGADRCIITDGPDCRHDGMVTRSARAGDVSDVTPLSQADATVLKALRLAACDFNDRSNVMFAAVLGDTSSVTYTQQLTAGMTYRFYNVPMLHTTCRNTGCSNLDLTACHVNVHSSQPMTCSFEVQYQAWMTPQYSLTDLTC